MLHQRDPIHQFSGEGGKQTKKIRNSWHLIVITAFIEASNWFDLRLAFKYQNQAFMTESSQEGQSQQVWMSRQYITSKLNTWKCKGFINPASLSAFEEDTAFCPALLFS